MKSIVKIASLAVLTASLVGISSAQGKPTKMAPKATCPVCHMALSATKNKANPVGVRLKKGAKVMYCCAGCKMPASVIVKGK